MLRSRRAKLAIVSSACLLAVVGGGVWQLRQSKSVPSAHSQTAVPKAAQPKPQISLASHMLFFGDVFWGRSIQTYAERSGLGPAYLFHTMTAQDKVGYDAWIANNECPVTTRDIAYQIQVDQLRFNCRPEYLPEIARWFDVMSLANNHTANNGGEVGLEETRNNLSNVGIQHFGTYDLHSFAGLCEVVAMPAHIEKSNEKLAIPVALCGFDYVGNVTPSASQMEQMKTYASVMPVIAMPHMGVEYRPTAEAAKVEVYHQLIDNGADLVVGSHPHVIQNSEAYHGKLIAYSVGNFLFDQQSLGRDTTLTLGVGVDLKISEQTAVQAYQEIGVSCKQYKDDCLARLQAVIKQRPAISVSYDYQCYDESKGTPTRASEAVCADIHKRATLDTLSGLAKSW